MTNQHATLLRCALFVSLCVGAQSCAPNTDKPGDMHSPETIPSDASMNDGAESSEGSNDPGEDPDAGTSTDALGADDTHDADVALDPLELCMESYNAPTPSPGAPGSHGLPVLTGERFDSVLCMPGSVAVQPALAVSASGEPLVVFTATPGEEGDLTIYASMAGRPAISLRSEPQGQRNEPSVCRLKGGGFALAWSYDGQAYGYTLGIEGAVLDSEGALLKSFALSTEVEGNHWLGHVGCDPDGGFTIVGSRTDTDDTTFGVFAQRYDAAGEPLGAAFGINPNPEGTQVQPVVGLTPGGRGVVLYEDAPVDESYRLSARAIGPEGATGEVFTLLSFEGVDCLKPAIAISPSGALAYAGNLGVQVHVLGAPSADSPVPTSTWLSTSGSQGLPALTFLDREEVLALAMIENLTGAGDPQINVTLLGEGLASETSAVLLGDDPQLPPYPPAIGYGGGVLAVAWTQRTDEGFEIHLTQFAAPTAP